MTTPPRLLLNRLPKQENYQLREANGDASRMITFQAAMELCKRGLVEGVGPHSGTIRFLRVLKEPSIVCADARLAIRGDEVESAILASRSTAFAVTNIGSYEQELSSGHVWSLCLLRNKGI